jgi:hypothetical protein
MNGPLAKPPILPHRSPTFGPRCAVEGHDGPSRQPPGRRHRAHFFPQLAGVQNIEDLECS